MRKSKAIVFGSYGWSGEAVGQLSSFLNNLEIATPTQIKINFVPTKQDLDNVTKQTKEFLVT